MADPCMVDKVADAMMAHYPGFNPSEEERAAMRAFISAAPVMTDDQAVKVGRWLRSSERWKARINGTGVYTDTPDVRQVSEVRPIG